MAPSSMTTEQGIEAIRLGDKERGKILLQKAVLHQPDDEQAWLWLSSVVSTVDQQLDCLRHVLEINPFNHAARRDLAAIPPRYHYDAPANTAKATAIPAQTMNPFSTPSIATAIPITTAQRAFRNDTVVGSGVGAASRTAGTTGGFGAQKNGATAAIPAVTIPAPTKLEPLDEQPRDPDYSPVQAVAARKFAQGVVRKKSAHVPQVGRIALGLVVFGVIVALMLALLGERARREQPSTTAGNVRATAVPRATTTLDPSGRSFGTASTAVTSPHGTLTVPGTAFVDGRVLDSDPPWTLDVVWIWSQPFETSRVQCKIPHGSAVLMLETETGPDGRSSVHIQRRDCEGWVSAELLSPKSVPAIGPVNTEDQGTTQK